MTRLLLRRLATLIPMMFIVSLLAFSLLYLVPGDPAATLAGPSATQEQVQLIREKLGTDKPLIEQYGRWAGKVVRGDFGSSLFSTQPVFDAIRNRMPVTLSLSFGALLVALVVGVPAGLLSGMRKGSWVDRIINLGAAGGLALPNYFVGMLLVVFVSLKLGWFPAVGFVPWSEDRGQWLRHLVLPCVALGLVPAAVLTRQLRSALIGVLGQDYIRTADAKGLKRRQVVLKHALKNAAVPAVTAMGAQFALLVGGSVVAEQIFGIPGMGSLAITAVQQRDMPVIQGVVITAAVMVQVINVLVDLSYGWLNPKVRVG